MSGKGPFGFGILGGRGEEEPLSGVTSNEGKILADAISDLRTRLTEKGAQIKSLQDTNVGLLGKVNELTASLNSAKTTIGQQATFISSLQKQVNDAFAKANSLRSEFNGFRGASLNFTEVSDARAIIKVFASSPVNMTKVNNLASLVDPGNFSPLKAMLDLVKGAGGLSKYIENSTTKDILTSRLTGNFVKPLELTNTLNGWDNSVRVKGWINKQHIINQGIDVPWVKGIITKGHVEGLGINKDWVNGFTSGFVNFDFIKARGFTPWSSVRDKMTRLVDTDTKLSGALTKVKDFHTKMTSYIGHTIAKGAVSWAGIANPVPDRDVTVEGNGPFEFNARCLKQAAIERKRFTDSLKFKEADEIFKAIMALPELKGVAPVRDGLKDLRDGMIGSDEKGGLRAGILNNKNDMSDMKTTP